MSIGKNSSVKHIKEAVDLIFKKYDLNRNGLLQQPQIKAMIQDTYISLDIGSEVSDQAIQDYLDRLDANGDRKLSRDEIAVMIRDMIA